MLTELYGKAGQVCQLAKQGQIRCPLIVRPTSEDVITGELFQALRYLNPQFWLPDLLNGALGQQRFRQQHFRSLKIELWQNQPTYPRRLLPWDEGSTQVDVLITWQNPPTTVFIEMKYGSDLSTTTSNGHRSGGYPTDQLIRNIRVGLWRCGWFEQDRLLKVTPRQFVQLVIAPQRGHELVDRYRQPERLRSAIPYAANWKQWPTMPFIGELGYGDVVEVLKTNRRFLTRTERLIADDLGDYLRFKLATKPTTERKQKQLSLENSDIHDSSPAAEVATQ